jgi:PPOX class probable F420-dependent enzyme
MVEIPAPFRDLLDAQFATLGTIAADGSPQLTEVWFLAVDGQVRISLNTSRRKVANLRRNPACSVLILDLANPHRYLEIRGTAQIEPDDDYTFAAQVGAKYGADLRQMDAAGETRVAVTIEARRVNAVDLSG